MRLRLSDIKFIACCLLAISLQGCSSSTEVSEDNPQAEPSQLKEEKNSNKPSGEPKATSLPDTKQPAPNDNQEPAASTQTNGRPPSQLVDSSAAEIKPPLTLNESTPTRELIAATDRLIRQSVASLPSNPDAMEMQARFEADYGDPTLATEIRQRILETQPNYLYAILGIAEHAQKTGQLKKAAELYAQVSSLAPADPSYPIQRAICLAEASEIKDALSVLADTCKQHSGSAVAHEELGKLLLQNQDPQGSIPAFEKSISLDESRVNSHGGLATAYMRLGKRDVAKKHMRIQQQLRRQERDSLAKQRSEYDDSQAVRTDIANHLTSMARVLQASTRSNEADQLLKHAVTIDKTHLTSRKLLLNQAKQKRDTAGALQWQKELCQIQPDLAAPHIQLALLLASSGKLDAAVEHLNNFANSHPNDSSVRIVLAQFYVDVRPDLTKAISFAREGAELSNKADDYAFLGSVFLRAGQVEQARGALEKAIELAPEKQQFKSMLQQLSNKE